MLKTLHILRSEPDDTVMSLIFALGGKEGTAVVSLYGDDISMAPVNWERLLDDIFTFDRVICWW